MNRGQPVADAEPVDLWFAFCDTVSPADAERLHRSLLSPEEGERFARFHHDRDRHAYLLAHAMLRRALSSFAAVPPRAWAFATDGFGKPYLSGPPGLHLEFNLSHTTGAVACAVARSRPVGVDVQADPEPGRIMSLAESVFSECETAMLNGLAAADRDRAATRLWTLKEALAKALGVGIRLPFPRIDFHLEPDPAGGLRASKPGRSTGCRWRCPGLRRSPLPCGFASASGPN
jgi:4'-phosphopantetheinyl transferase